MFRLIAGLALLAHAAHALSHCTYNVDAMHATYDLSPLSSWRDYIVRDEVRAYTYFFNICNYASLPEGCANLVGESPSAVYQYDERNNKCYRLQSGPVQPTFSLLDAGNPSKGVVMKVTGGDHCQNPDADRSFTINFVCSRGLGLDKNVTSPVSEPSRCQYAITIDSIFACPRECDVGLNRILCSGHGFCGLDTDAYEGKGAPRCYCNEGYSGADCGTVGSGASSDDGPDSDMETKNVVLVLAMLFVAALVIAAVVLLVRVDRMKLRKQQHAMTAMNSAVLDDAREEQIAVSTAGH